MNLIIISGAEATCKTAIGKEIATSLGYQYKSKDIIKESLFDKESKTTWNYGWYERRAKQLFWREIAALIKNGTDAVIESNFIGQDKKTLEKLLRAAPIRLSEVYCYAKGLTSFKRFVRRNETKARHRGHHDRRWYPLVFLRCSLKIIGIQILYRPVGLTDKLLNVDTTHYSKIDFKKIVEFARSE